LRRLSASRRHLFNSRLLTLTLEAPAEKGRANWQFDRISPKTASKDLRSRRDEFIRHVTNKFVTTKTASKESRQISWERRHPCLLGSFSRSLPETPQARMPALPGNLPYPRAAIFILSGGAK